MCSGTKTFQFSENDYVYTTSWQEPINLTKFDETINSYWDSAMASGYFKYKFNIPKTVHLKGKFGMVAQLNIDRARSKRKAQNIQNMDDPFNPDKFNFTQIPDEEKILRLTEGEVRNCDSEDLIAINVSPLAPSHCLLLPQMSKMLPQVLTFQAIKMALQALLLSGTPSFRIGFNSLCGFASVNHLHLHTFLIPKRMFLETAPLKHVAASCYEVDQYAIKGFVFERAVSSAQDIVALARDTHKLTSFLQDRKIAHNVNFSRSGTSHEEIERRNVRVYVWAREYSGVKKPAAFSPALCEFFGLLDFKNEELFNVATEESVCEILQSKTSSCFEFVRSAVYELFNETADEA